MSSRKSQVLDLIAEAAEELDVPYELALAVGITESNLNPNVRRGAAGEIGVFQIMPRWHQVPARRMGFDIRTLEGNVYYGVWLLGSLLQRERGNVVNALRRYNGGPGYARIAQTQQYARKVLSNMKGLRDKGFRPVRGGSISSHFGEARDSGDHSGIDIAAPHGTPTFSAASGKVVRARKLKTSYGWHVVVRDPAGRDFYYAHLSAMHVKVGDTVRAGQQIGAVGSTGNSTGPHLHFEVRENGQAIDPTPWIKGRAPAAFDDDPVGTFEEEKQTFAQMVAEAFGTDLQTAMAATDQFMGSFSTPAGQQVADQSATLEGAEADPSAPQPLPGDPSTQAFQPLPATLEPDEEPTGIGRLMEALLPTLGGSLEEVSF